MDIDKMTQEEAEIEFEEEEDIPVVLGEEDFVADNSYHISSDEIEARLPNRNSFVNKDLRDLFENKIRKGEKVVFMPIDIFEAEHKDRYCINIVGSMPCGTKILIVATDVPLYFDVKVPKENPQDVLTQNANSRELPEKDPEAFLTYLRNYMVESRISYKKLEVVEGFPLKGFQINCSSYVRIHFGTLYSRLTCLKDLSNSYELVNDDNGKGAYLLKIAREFKFNTCGWNKIEGGYTFSTHKESGHYEKVSNCDICIYTPIESIKPGNEVAIATKEFLKQPKVMLMTWDIETYSTVQTGGVPKEGDSDYWIFMISATFHWYYEENSLMKVCLVDVPTQVRDGIFYSPEQIDEVKNLPKEERKKMLQKISQANYLIECGSEKRLLEAFGDVIGKMQPDIISAFNGGNFDWVLVRDKMNRYKMLGDFKKKISALPYNEFNRKWSTNNDSVYKYSFSKENVKITADDYHHMLSLKIPGILDLDVMPIFRQIHPRGEVGMKKSLNFYLMINGLGSKIDLPYKQMFRYYEASLSALKNGKNLAETKQLMSIVAEYCVVDSFRCQQLLIKRNVINERREIAMSSYVRLYEAFYRGNGIKVRNLTGAYCYDMGIVFSNSRVNNKKIGYPGAHVFPPKKGLNNKYPVVAVDFSSLYPSLMMTYDLSPEKAIVEESEEDVAYAHKLMKMGYILHRVEFVGTSEETGEKIEVKGWVVRHSNVIEEGDHPRHNGKELNRPALPGEKMGLFPYILKTLYEKRKAIKGRMNRLKVLLEAIKKESQPAPADLFEGTGYTPEIANIEDIKFTIKILDAKQNAMKVNMNTFYGEQGNHLSTIYMLLIAGAITQAGKYNIKLVSNLIKNSGYVVHYGDSVVGDTPVLCKAPDGSVGYHRIEDLSSHFVLYGKGKEVSDCEYEVWSDMGWTPIKKVIRHKTNKKIYRITTGTGCVDATEDHSLLDPKGNKVRPEEVSPGQFLLHANLPNVNVGDEEEAFIKRTYGKSTKDKMIASKLFHYWTSKGHSCHIYVEGDVYNVMVGKHGPTDEIRSISLLGKSEGFVYDLETENHHFSAGVGRMVVHNTDSNYVSSPSELFQDLDEVYYENREIIQKEATKEGEGECNLAEIEEKVRGEIVNFQNNSAVAHKQQDLKAIVASVSDIFRSLANALITLVKTHPKATPAMWRWLRARLKEQYWIQLVRITRRDINALKDFINKTLEEDNGTPYLKMAYEEVLFPVVFLGKKKYFGYQHLENENFYPDNEDIFIKGVEIIKQGQTELAKTIGMRIIKKCCSVEHESDIESLVIEELENIYKQEWHQEDFILKAKYKPDKKNVPVQTFVKRMKEIYEDYLEQAKSASPEEAKKLNKLASLYEPPKPDDTFEYIIVNKGQLFGGRGNKVNTNKGEKMEYFEVFKHWNNIRPGSMIWDLNHYMNGSILGLFARFISYKEQFQPPEEKYPFREDATEKQEIDRLKKIDNYVINKGKRYLNDISLGFAGIDIEKIKEKGKQYKKVFRGADKIFKESLDYAENFALKTFKLTKKNKGTTEEEFLHENYSRLDERILQESSHPSGYLDLLRKLEGGEKANYSAMKTRYGDESTMGRNKAKPRKVVFKEMKREVMGKIKSRLGNVMKILKDDKEKLEELLLEKRGEEIAEETIREVSKKTDKEKEALKEFHALVVRATALQTLVNYYGDLAEEIKKREMKKSGGKPSWKSSAKEAKEIASKCPVLEVNPFT